MGDKKERGEMDVLRTLMRGMPCPGPESGYVRRIMARVAAAEVRRQRRRERWMLLLPCGASLALVALAIWIGVYGGLTGGRPMAGDTAVMSSVIRACGDRVGEAGGSLTEGMAGMAAPWVGIMLVALLLLVFDHMMRRAYARRHR